MSKYNNKFLEELVDAYNKRKEAFKDNTLNLDPINKFKKGGIYIKPENKGKFTRSAKRAGMSVQEFARHVLANKDKYSTTQIKRAAFAKGIGGSRKKK